MKAIDHNPRITALRSPVARKVHPPRHLSTASKRWWRSVVTEWEMSDTDLKILVMACEALDRAERARKALLEEGEFYTDTKGIVHSHPAVGVESTSKKLAAKLIADLRLDMPQPRPVGRPGGPGIKPNRSY